MVEGKSQAAEPSPTPPPIDIFYAPVQKMVRGNPTLTCVGIEYQDSKEKAISASKCASMARQVEAFYQRASRGNLQFKPKGVALKVPFDAKPANYMKAVALAKQKFKSDYYMVTGNFGTSHAGSKTAYLRGSLYRDAQHEVGHLLGLGHAGSYRDGKLEAYGDGGSVMGKFPSNSLTAPQYYSRGWLPEEEALLYVPPSEPGLSNGYRLKQITDFGKNYPSLIVVNPKYFNGRDPDALPAPDKDARKAYISFPSKCFNGAKECVAIHLGIGNGAGTQKVATFTKEYYDERFTGLHVKVMDVSNGTVYVVVDFKKKPAGK